MEAQLEGVELRRIAMPLVAPFRTSFGTELDREVVLVRVVSADAEGWGECVAMAEPLYSSEYVDSAADVIRRFLVPALGRCPTWRYMPPSGRSRGSKVIRWRRQPSRRRFSTPSFARSACRCRCSSAPCTSPCRPAYRSASWTRSRNCSTQSSGYLAEGYLRIKLKIEPGWDVGPVRAVRERFGDDVLLQVDANTAYTLADSSQLAKLDAFGLLLIEQPLAEDDIAGHAELARVVRTPICLDESITSARMAAEAIRIGATRIVNIKPGRVGGYLEARRIHDVCAANGIPVWCGGMLETGIGRAANVALAALPNFTLPGDTSASNRYYLRDITGRSYSRRSCARTGRRRHRRRPRQGRSRRGHPRNGVAAALGGRRPGPRPAVACSPAIMCR